jgi:chemotaxis signal transduction protein
MVETVNSLADVSILPRTLGLSDEDENRERRDLLIMRSGSKLISIFADEADSVTQGLVCTPLPRAPSTILGVTTVRGAMHTVINPLPLISSPKEHEKDVQLNFTVALRGEAQLALAVERVERIIEIFTDSIETPANINRLFRGLIQHEGNLVIVLNVNQIFLSAMGE